MFTKLKKIYNHHKFLFFIAIIGILFIFSIKKSEYSKESREDILLLSPAHSYVMQYVNLEENVSAVSNFDTNPVFKDKKKIHGGIFFNEEDILKIKPDFVTIGDIQRNNYTIAFLKSHNIHPVIMNTRSFEDIYQSLLDLNHLFRDKINKNKIELFKKKWFFFRENPVKNRRSALVIIDIDPIYTISQKNYMNEMLFYAGWDNIMRSKANYPILSEEDLYYLPKVDSIIIPERLKNEKKYLKKIQKITKAKHIIAITDKRFFLPSPYIAEITEQLLILNTNL